MLSPFTHALIIVAGVVLLRWLPRGRRSAFGALALCALLVALAHFAPQPALVVVGKEGVVEALTEATLLLWVGAAVRARMPLLAALAALLFLEEVDYGQVFFGFETPGWIAALSPTSDRTNFHNIPALDVLWRLGLLVSLWALSLRAIAARLQGARIVPVFATHHAYFLGLLALGALAQAIAGDRVADELHELAAVWGAWALWRRPPPPAGAAHRARRARP